MAEITSIAGEPWPEFVTRLRRYVAARVADRWVDDVVGDILLRLAEHSADLEKASNPLAWMYRVAANVIADHYRRRDVETRALKSVETEASTQDLSSIPGGEDDDAVEQELIECLSPFIKDLPPKYAAALMLTDLGNLTQADAAEQLGLSPSGAKSRVQRGRSLLKQRILDCCEIELDRRGRVMNMTPRENGK